MYKISFTDDVQRAMLAQVNAINIVAITTVVFVAMPFCMNAGSQDLGSSTMPGLQDVIHKLEHLLPLLLLVSVPVVALTASARNDDEQACMGAGCDAFLTKPIDRKLLVQTIGAFAKREQS